MNRNETLLHWADVLESGEYNQTDGQLRGRLFQEGLEDDEYGYCCMGVYVDILHESGVLDGRWARSESYEQGGDMISGDLSGVINMPWVKVTESEQAVLVRMNDGADHDFYSEGKVMHKACRQHSFKEIAKHIRDNLVTEEE
jgi:hypothetical protein